MDRTLQGYLPWLPSDTWSHLPPATSRWSLLEKRENSIHQDPRQGRGVLTLTRT